MGSPWRMFRGRTLAKIVAVVAAVIMVVVAMAFVPCTLTIEGHGSLLPEERRKVYSPVPSAIVAEVLVDHGSRVKKGDLLVKLDSPELQKELKGLMAEQSKAEDPVQLPQEAGGQGRIDPGIAGRHGYQPDPGPALRGQVHRGRARQRIEIIQEQLESMNVRAPQDGIITTWEAKKTLMGRPVEVGTELLQIAGTEGDWLLEVEVPDDDMGPVLAAKHNLTRTSRRGGRSPTRPFPPTS